MCKVLLLTHDLLLQSQLQGAAQLAGVKLLVADAASDVASLASDATCVSIDLGNLKRDINDIVSAIRESAASPPKIWAFGPHVQTQLLASARQAGCELVTSRGDFVTRAAERFGSLAN